MDNLQVGDSGSHYQVQRKCNLKRYEKNSDGHAEELKKNVRPCGK
jgi:hypothetical protein